MEDGTDASDGEPLLKHVSASDGTPEPIEPQLLFLRAVPLIYSKQFI